MQSTNKQNEMKTETGQQPYGVQEIHYGPNIVFVVDGAEYDEYELAANGYPITPRAAREYANKKTAYFKKLHGRRRQIDGLHGRTSRH